MALCCATCSNDVIALLDRLNISFQLDLPASAIIATLYVICGKFVQTCLKLQRIQDLVKITLSLADRPFFCCPRMYSRVQSTHRKF